MRDPCVRAGDTRDLWVGAGDLDTGPGSESGTRDLGRLGTRDPGPAGDMPWDPGPPGTGEPRVRPGTRDPAAVFHEHDALGP